MRYTDIISRADGLHAAKVFVSRILIIEIRDKSQSQKREDKQPTFNFSTFDYRLNVVLWLEKGAYT